MADSYWLDIQQLSKYKVNKKPIGKGSFATVFLAIDIEGNKVAIKQIAIDAVGRTLRRKFESELEMSTILKHPNIVNCIETFKTDHFWYIVSEFCDGGTMFDLFQTERAASNEQKEQDARKIFLQLRNALKYLRKKNIIHRDLKPQNILFKMEEGELVLKIADFGLARYYDSSSFSEEGYFDMASTFCGSPLYMAPEMLLEDRYNVKADLWSLGLILYEILYKAMPYQKPHSIGALRKVIKEQAIVFPEYFSQPCMHLVKSLLTQDPAMRIAWSDFFHHPWFEDVLLKKQFKADITVRRSDPVPIRTQKDNHVEEAAAACCDKDEEYEEEDKDEEEEDDARCNDVSDKKTEMDDDILKDFVVLEDTKTITKQINLYHSHSSSYSGPIIQILSSSLSYLLSGSPKSA